MQPVRPTQLMPWPWQPWSINEKWNVEALALLILTGETGMHLQA